MPFDCDLPFLSAACASIGSFSSVPMIGFIVPGKQRNNRVAFISPCKIAKGSDYMPTNIPPQRIRGYDHPDDHAKLVTTSYKRFYRADLLPSTAAEVEEGSLTERLFRAPFVVLSHDSEADPVLTYGNAAALALWERDWEAFTSMPSRYTAEPMLREERDAFLRSVAEQGFVQDFAGIRVSSTGKRYRIHGGAVWNLVDDAGQYRGQAAAFRHYVPIE
jgi:hypothetical protein